MSDPDFPRAIKATALAHAVSSRVRKRTKASARRCRARRRRVIAALEDGEVVASITGVGVVVSASEVEALRPDAIAAVRQTCAECGLCTVFGLKPP